MSRRDYYRIEDMEGEHIFKISEISYVSPVRKYGDIVGFHVVADGLTWAMRDKVGALSMIDARLGLVNAMLKLEGRC